MLNDFGSRPSDSRKSSQEEYTLAASFLRDISRFHCYGEDSSRGTATHATQKNQWGEGREGENQRNRRSSISGSETRITILPPRLLSITATLIANYRTTLTQNETSSLSRHHRRVKAGPLDSARGRSRTLVVVLFVLLLQIRIPSLDEVDDEFGRAGRLGDVCGTVVNAIKPARARARAPQSSRPGTYHPRE